MLFSSADWLWTQISSTLPSTAACNRAVTHVSTGSSTLLPTGSEKSDWLLLNVINRMFISPSPLHMFHYRPFSLDGCVKQTPCETSHLAGHFTQLCQG